jgi:hypothetical protein
VLVEPSHVHAQPVDVFGPPFERLLLLLHELRAINKDLVDRCNVIITYAEQQLFLKDDALDRYEKVAVALKKFALESG